MKKKLVLLLSLLLIACLLCSCAYLPQIGTQTQSGAADTTEDSDTVTISREEYERYQKMDTLLQLMDMTEYYFYQDTDEEKMLDGAAAGMLYALGDPYTFYYTPEDYAEMWEDDEGEYAGVGIQISASYETGLCTISRVFSGGSAQEAGIHKGDILYQVEDIMVTALNLQDAVDIMRGTPGTAVKVVFLRNDEEMTYELERRTINVNRVDAGMLTEDIGCIALYEFAGDCADKFIEALDSLMAQNAKGIIIDMRDNPGGWVQDAETIGDLFLDEGTLYYLEHKDGTREYCKTKDGKVDVQLVILMNENSASTAEILAGALQDRTDATIVGVQSYGKGIVQYVLPVGTEGAGMQVTAAQYFTPNGNAVHKIGITPDVECPLPEGDNGMYEFADTTDPQLAKAIEIMQEKLK